MGLLDIEALKSSIGKKAVLGFLDGEVTLAELHLVSEEDQIFIFDVVWTNRPERYKQIGAAYQAALADVQEVASADTLSALLRVVFSPDEDPLFVDSGAPVEEITPDPETLLERIRRCASADIGPEHLGMNLPELALYLQRKNR